MARSVPRLTILLSAYSCRPNRGSEPGVGWNIATRLAGFHDVHVLTTPDQKGDIEAELASNPVAGLSFHYHSLGLGWPIRKDGRLVQLHYYLWQLSLYYVGRRLMRETRFDLIQHVTLVRYWMPNGLAWLGVPFIFGPIGGAEPLPARFFGTLDLWSRIVEHLRNAARGLSRFDPFLRSTLRCASLTLATTPATGDAVRRLGAQPVEQCFESALAPEDLERLSQLPQPDGDGFRVLSSGRLVGWKGVHLGLRAFAEAAIPGSSYRILGSGPREAGLRNLAKKLGIADRVHFEGAVPRPAALAALERCHVLLHPSLHDSGGWACVEAMAAGRPIICLALGGPSQQVPDTAGFRVAADTPDQVIHDMARHLTQLAADRLLARQMGEAGRAHALTRFSWSMRMADFERFYETVLRPSIRDPGVPESVPHLTLAGVRVGMLNLSLACGEIERRLATREGGYFIFRDAHGIVGAHDDPELMAAHRGAGFVAPDGMPLVWAGKRAGAAEMARVYGPDFMLALCARLEGRPVRHFLFGSTDRVLERLELSLRRKFPAIQICGRYSPPFRSLGAAPDPDHLDRLRAARPDIVWVGLGTPKQELWMHRHARELPGMLLMGVGAAFDFHAGTTPQAPVWMQRSGLEWSFRVLTEPRRLGRRYLSVIPRFLILLVRKGVQLPQALDSAVPAASPVRAAEV